MRTGSILKAVALALGFSTAFATPADAAPLVALVFGQAFAATIAGQLIGVVTGAVGTYLFSSLVGKWFPPKNDTTASAPTEVKYGERVARSAVFGTVLVGGQLAHINEYSKATQLQYLCIVGDGWHHGISAIKVDDALKDVTETTLSSNNEHKRYTVEDYSGLIDLRFHDGRPGQLADTSVVAQTSGWTSNKKFSNLAYFVADVKSDKKKFSGIPSFAAVVEGLHCYDPRKDTTVGGSGSHRFDTPSTWEYSTNPFVQGYHYLRGFYFNNVRVLGPGYNASELSLSHWITAMNVADEDVLDPAGGTRKRYECHMEVLDTEDFASVLDRFCKAGGGFWTEVAGQIVVFAGKAQSSVLTLTDDDLIADVGFEFNPGKPGEALITGVQGTYMHSTDFQPTPYTTLEPTEFLSSNWYPHIQEMNFPQVKNAHQAYLLAKQYLYANRVQATASVTADFKDIMLQVNDWITWTSSLSMIGTRTWRIVGVRYNLPQRRMLLSLAETSVDIFDDDATPDDIAEPVRTLPAPDYIRVVPNFAVATTTVVGGTGEVIPALEFTYTPIIDPAILAVDIYYRVKADGLDPAGELYRVTDFSVSDGTYRVTNGVAPSKVHEAYALLIAAPGRDIDTTPYWVETTVDTDPLTVLATISDMQVDIEKLSADLQNVVSLLTSVGGGSVWATIEALQEEIERQANAAYTNNMNMARETELLARTNSTHAAAVIFEREVRISEDAALAQAILEVEASIDDAITNGLANGYLKFEAIVDTLNSKASIAAKVRATFGDTYSEAGWILQAHADGSGGSDGFFGIMGTMHVFDTVDGDPTAVFTAGSDGLFFGKLTSYAVTAGSVPIVILDGNTGAFSITIDV